MKCKATFRPKYRVFISLFGHENLQHGVASPRPPRPASLPQQSRLGLHPRGKSEITRTSKASQNRHNIVTMWRQCMQNAALVVPGAGDTSPLLPPSTAPHCDDA